MATNPYKAFIPFHVNRPGFFPRNDQVQDAHKSVDPSGSTWRTWGLVPCSDGNFSEDLDGAGQQMIVQFNERILPGKVRDEHLKTKLTRFFETEGRPVSKKEYAQFRDEVEQDLLPKAFIRRTEVRVVFTKGLMLVFTASAKRATDVMSLMSQVFGEDLCPASFMSKKPMVDVLTAAMFDRLPCDDDLNFTLGTSVVLKGEDKQTIRIKDKDLQAHEIQNLKAQDYKAHELQLFSEEHETWFTVNAGFIFKGVEMANVKYGDAKEDRHGYSVLIVQVIRNMLESFTEAIGGVAEAPKPEAKKIAIDLDDEEL